MDCLLSMVSTTSIFFLYRTAFLTCFRSFWCLFRIPFFTAGYGDDAKHKVAGAGGEERGGGGNQPLGKVTVNIFTKGERVVMHKDISHVGMIAPDSAAVLFELDGQ